MSVAIAALVSRSFSPFPASRGMNGWSCRSV